MTTGRVTGNGYVTGIPGHRGRMRAFDETRILPTSLLATKALQLDRLRERKERLATIATWVNLVEERLASYRQEQPDDELVLGLTARRISEAGGQLRLQLAHLNDQIRAALD